MAERARLHDGHRRRLVIRVKVVAFARVRELLGFGAAEIEIDDGATAETLWDRLVYHADELAALRGSTRFARNGDLIDGAAVLADGDELALMPPVGGG